MRLFRTIRSGPFRLALLFAAIFAVGSIVLIVVVETGVSRYAQQITADTLMAEAVRLVAIDQKHGRRAVTNAINEREKLRRQPILYRVTDQAGNAVAGELPRKADHLGWSNILIAEPATTDDPPDEPVQMKTVGVMLTGGGHLIIGSDVYDTQELREWLNAVELWSGIGITILALIAGYLIASVYSNRLERLNTSINSIMAGKLSERVPVVGMGEEFDQLSANLNRMLDRIEALMSGVRQVSTDIAHDLRTPITRLRQHLESAINDDRGAAAHEVIEKALSQIDAIMTIFGALLRIGSIEAGAGRARFQRVDLSEIMQRVLLAYQPVAEDGGRTISGAITPGIFVQGDADLLAQLFTNLVENALTHTQVGVKIVLSLVAENGRKIAEVSDTGSGVVAEERDNVMKRFYRLDSSRADAGAGLGLALVAAVAELHSARISLENARPGLRVRLEWTGA